MTGLELIQRLQEKGLQTPIIISLGNARYVSANDLAGLGNVKFVPKPFELSSLMEHVAVMLALAK